jgi:hypothetical protein
VNHLKVRSCLIDGEVVCCDDRGLAVFQALRRRQNEAQAFLYAFDLLELDGLDMRREPIETRKATLASLLRNGKPGMRLNEHIAHPNADASQCVIGEQPMLPWLALTYTAARLGSENCSTVPAIRNIKECPDGRTRAHRPKAHRVGEDGRGAVTRLERRGGVAIALEAPGCCHTRAARPFV